MKQKTNCMYCGREFLSTVKKMWVIWLCNEIELETTTESGEVTVIHDKQRIKTCGAKETLEQAEAFVIPNMKKDQCKDIQKVTIIQEQFCGRCKHDAKIYHDRVMARMKKESKARAKASGDKSGQVSVVSDKDYMGYLRFLVEQKIEKDYRVERQRQGKVKEAETKNKTQMLMSSTLKDQKVNKVEEQSTIKEDNHVNGNSSTNDGKA